MTTENSYLAEEAADAGCGADNYYLDLVRAIEQTPELNVPVSSLVPGFYLRQTGTDAAHVRLLADAAGSIRLPPILVQKSSSRIIDGMHRFEAAKRCGRKLISVRVIDCTDGEALILAVKSNTLHGLPLSKPDRIAGAKRILIENPDWSDRALAEVAGLSAKTIGVLRNRSAENIPRLGKRLGRDGKRRPLNAAEGRRRAADYIKAHPDVPVRRVASETDVSISTAHDVRERIRRGEDPVAERRGSLTGKAAGLPSAGDPPDPSVSAGTAAAVNVRTAPHDLHMKHNARKNHDARPSAWLAISAKLADDPAVRYTEGGRAFLQWMAQHAAQAEDWREFGDSIPVHWLADISLIASRVSEEWQQFAEWLKFKQESAGEA